MQKALGWLIYESVYRALQMAMVLGWSMRSKGGNNLPATGPVLMVANHASYLDPIAVGIACSRHLAYLAKKPLFDNRLWGGYLRRVNAVPIDQDGVAIEGIRNILTRLHEGWPVLVFPEGGRCGADETEPLQPGVSLLVKRVGAPIVPVGIAGTFWAWSRDAMLPTPSPLFLPPSKRNIAVVIGKPRPAETIANLPRQEMLAVIHADICKCVAEARELQRK